MSEQQPLNSEQIDSIKEPQQQTSNTKNNKQQQRATSNKDDQNKKKVVGNRIIVTNLGLNLMKEADDDNQVDNEIRKGKLRQSIIRKKKVHDESTMYIGQLLQDNNQKTTASINEKVVLATKPFLNPKKHVRSMENLFKHKLPPEQKTNYINKQINKYSKQIMNPSNSLLSQNMNASMANITKLNNQSNLLGSMNDYTLESKQLHAQDDINTLDKYNKVLFAESKIEHIHRRYREFSEEHEKLQNKIHQEYNRRIFESVEHHQKKLSLLEEISKENEELIDILHRNTMYGKRKQQRNIDYMKNKYMGNWKKFQLPKLTQKSLKIHEQHEKFRNRPAIY